MTKTKYTFHHFNDEMKKLGGRPVTWKEFISGGVEKGRPGRPRIDPLLKKKSKRSSYNFDHEPEPEKVVRPKAVYDNKSVYEKYDI
jgi:hypothetical protein